MLIDNMIRAAKLDTSLYEQVERNEDETVNAMIVVVLAALATGIGAGGLGFGLANIANGIIGALVFWVVAAILTYYVGTRLFGGTATIGELLRTIGYAQSPGVLLIFAFIPILGVLLSFVVSIWLLVTLIVAIRQALDFSTGRAIGTGIVAWFAGILVSIAWAMLTGALRAIF